MSTFSPNFLSIPIFMLKENPLPQLALWDFCFALFFSFNWNLEKKPARFFLNIVRASFFAATP